MADDLAGMNLNKDDNDEDPAASLPLPKMTMERSAILKEVRSPLCARPNVCVCVCVCVRALPSLHSIFYAFAPRTSAASAPTLASLVPSLFLSTTSSGLSTSNTFAITSRSMPITSRTENTSTLPAGASSLTDAGGALGGRASSLLNEVGESRMSVDGGRKQFAEGCGGGGAGGGAGGSASAALASLAASSLS